MRLWLTIYLLIGFFSVDIYGQGGFTKKIFPRGFTTSGAHEVIEAPDGNLISCGIGIDSSTGISKLVVLITDHNGIPLVSKSFGRQNLFFYDNDNQIRGPMIKDHSGFYYAASIGDSNNRTLGMLIKFNFAGDSLWNRIFRIDAPKDIIFEGLFKNTRSGIFTFRSIAGLGFKSRPTLYSNTY
jgi:hypothetical protein